METSWLKGVIGGSEFLDIELTAAEIAMNASVTETIKQTRPLCEQEEDAIDSQRR